MNDTPHPNGGAVVRLVGPMARGNTQPVALKCGDLIGRHACCALQLDHPGSALVAAAVVRRGRRVFLEGQTDQPTVDGVQLRRVRLSRGLRVELPTASLVVERTLPPTCVLAAAIADHPPQELGAPFYSLRAGLKPDLLPGEIPNPDAIIVDTAAGWRIAVGHQAAQPLLPNRMWQIAGTTLRTSLVRLDPPTGQEPNDPLGIELDLLSGGVRIRRASRHRVTLKGGPARLIHSLFRAGGVTRPEDIEQATGSTVRDVLDDMSDLLRAHGLRSDLVRPDGLGGVELFLHSFDRVDARDQPESD